MFTSVACSKRYFFCATHPIFFFPRCSQHGEYFSNVLIKTLTFLEEIHLKAKEDVNIFFKDLMQSLEKIPKNVAQNHVLQQIIRAYEFGNEGSYLVPPFLKVCKHLTVAFNILYFKIFTSIKNKINHFSVFISFIFNFSLFFQKL